jgi:hypothetical protein
MKKLILTEGRTILARGRVRDSHGAVRLAHRLLIAFAVALTVCGGRTARGADPQSYSTITKYAIPLFVVQTSSQQGDIQTLAAQKVIKGRGVLTWQVTVPEDGDYEVIVGYAAHDREYPIEAGCEGSTLSDTLPQTSGVYSESGQWYQNSFERRKMPGILHVSNKSVKVFLRTLNDAKDKALVVYALELQRLGDRNKIAAEVRAAIQSRPNTDWFAKMRYGLMFHWTSQTAPRTGHTRPYKDAVQGFDVDAFVRMVEQSGASYVLFTGNHADPTFPGPLKEWEKTHPGWTTERDLIADIADGLSRRGIRFLLYLATHTYAKVGKVGNQEFADINHRLITEIGNRYGAKISGYWLDGWYQAFERYRDFPFESFYQASKAANPERLLALNSWLYPITTPWQDYWAAEIYSLGVPPQNRIIQSGPGESLQYHALLALEGDWVHTKENTPIQAPVLGTPALLSFMDACAGKGPVTLNVLIYQDGTISESSMNVLRAINKHINDR